MITNGSLAGKTGAVQVVDSGGASEIIGEGARR
jgi:hypothetical protein